MRESLPLFLGLLGGLVGGFIAGTLASSGPGDAPDPALAALDAPESDPEAGQALEQRIRELEAETSSLRVTMDSLRADLAMMPREGGGRAPLADAAAPGPDGEAAAEAGDLALTGDPYFDARVLAVLEAREEARRREQEARAAERRERMLDARVDRLREQLGLDDVQAASLREVLARSDEQRRQLFESLRDAGGFDREAIAEQMRSIEAQARESLSGILTPQQMEQLDQLGPRAGLGGFGGFRGPRGRDRGPGPGR